MSASMFQSLAIPRSFTVSLSTFDVGPNKYVGFDEDMTTDQVSSMCALLTDLVNVWQLKGAAPKLSAEGR